VVWADVGLDVSDIDREDIDLDLLWVSWEEEEVGRLRGEFGRHLTT
jgi:hypothetical protein